MTPFPPARALLLEAIAKTAHAPMSAAGLLVEAMPKALEGVELGLHLQGVEVLGIRSRTQLRREAFLRPGKLLAVGCFSVGTNQVDLDAARQAGIPVFNAPFSNTRSVAELVIGEIVMLMRRIFPRSSAAHQGGWDKSAKDSLEVRGKTLGIVGYGNIGSQLSTLAEGMGMRVVFHDTVDKLRHGNSERVGSLAELLAVSDVVSLHVPETADTRGMIGAGEIAAMKDGAYLINNSRGTVVDLEALAGALRSGKLRGAAVDVFPVEPSANGEAFRSPLQGLDNVILTPHVGGSTEEAQERIGAEVGHKLAGYFATGSTVGAVNFPQVQLPPRGAAMRFAHVHRNVPGILGRLNDVLSRHNIVAQHLETDGDLGYVVIDAEMPPEGAGGMLDDLRRVEGTLRARLVS